MLLLDSLEGSDIASRDRPLNLLIPPTVGRDVLSVKSYSTVTHPNTCDFYEFSLPFVGLDKELQVELVHVVEDVVAVRSDQVLVVVDLLLR